MLKNCLAAGNSATVLFGSIVTSMEINRRHSFWSNSYIFFNNFSACFFLDKAQHFQNIFFFFPADISEILFSITLTESDYGHIVLFDTVLQ